MDVYIAYVWIGQYNMRRICLAEVMWVGANSLLTYITPTTYSNTVLSARLLHTHLRPSPPG